MFLKRVTSEAYALNENLLSWIERNRCGESGVSCQTYVARENLHVCVALLIDEYATNQLREPLQTVVPARRPIPNSIAAEVERKLRPTAEKSGLLVIVFKPFAFVGKSMRTFIKFLFLALIAEPEFQRELAYVLTGNIFRKIITFMVTRIWIFARFMQVSILPFFFVFSQSITLIASFTNGRMPKCSRDT